MHTVWAQRREEVWSDFMLNADLDALYLSARLCRIRLPACTGGLFSVKLGSSIAGQAPSDGIEHLAQGHASSAHLLWMAHRYHRLRYGLRYGGLWERLWRLRHPHERGICLESFHHLRGLLVRYARQWAVPAVPRTSLRQVWWPEGHFGKPHDDGRMHHSPEFNFPYYLPYPTLRRCDVHLQERWFPGLHQLDHRQMVPAQACYGAGTLHGRVVSGGHGAGTLGCLLGRPNQLAFHLGRPGRYRTDTRLAPGLFPAGRSQRRGTSARWRRSILSGEQYGVSRSARPGPSGSRALEHIVPVSPHLAVLWRVLGVWIHHGHDYDAFHSLC